MVNRESGMVNGESGIGNRESGIGNRESGIGNRESGIGNKFSQQDIQEIKTYLSRFTFHVSRFARLRETPALSGKSHRDERIF
jgi:hypothetical protein